MPATAERHTGRGKCYQSIKLTDNLITGTFTIPITPIINRTNC